MNPATNKSKERQGALQLARQAMIKPPAIDLLPETNSAAQFADILVSRGHWQDALNYMSHAIPPREAIWWAWYCARKVLLEDAPPEVLDALKVGEMWIAQPVEENRLKARHLAARAPAGQPQQLVLEAITATGELEDPVSGNKVPPIPYMPAKYIFASVMGSCYVPDPEKPEETATDFLRQAFEVAARINLWSNYD